MQELLARVKVEELEHAIEYEFNDKDVLALACIHRSCVQGRADLDCNQRLEFLGDSVLGLLVAEVLYVNTQERATSVGEGKLTEMRKLLVDKVACEVYGRKIGLRPFIVVDDVIKPSAELALVADAFEALVGALYMDAGLERCKLWFKQHFEVCADRLLQRQDKNWKTLLQEWLQHGGGGLLPHYELVGKRGAGHELTFVAEVAVVAQGNNERRFRGEGRSKKLAQQAAAKLAYEKLSVEQSKM